MWCAAGYFIMARTDHLTVPDKYLSESTAACPVMARWGRVLPEGSRCLRRQFHHTRKHLTARCGGWRVRRDWALCRWLAHEAGVIAIPPSAFYSAGSKVRCTEVLLALRLVGIGGGGWGQCAAQ